MSTELSRPVAVERVGPTGLEVAIEATPAECAALAVRMNLPAIQRLTCDFRLERDQSGTLLAFGRLRAAVMQVCILSLEEFTAELDERFTVRCVPEGEESEDVDPDALDEVVYPGGTLDLGEAAAEQLALALDPYPRAPGAELPEVSDEPDAHPFASLEALRRRH